jgi:glutathione peroxidase-family protein
MGYGALDLAQLNMQRGKYEVAFDILFDAAVNDQNDDALFLLTKMTFDGKVLRATKWPYQLR